MDIIENTIDLEHTGAQLRGQLRRPADDVARPGVLVMHNAHGLGPQTIAAAEALAGLGYVALATDLYGGGIFHDGREASGRAIAPLWGRPLIRERSLAWLHTLKGLPGVDAHRTAAIGYCFGGQCVLEIARSGADLAAVVSYHGLLMTPQPAAPGQVRARVAVYTGSHDPHVPAAHVAALREEMNTAGAHWQLTEFGDAWHSFTDPSRSTTPEDGQAYHPVAAAVSWAGTLALLEATLG